MKKSTRALILLAGLALAFLAFGLLGHDSRSRRALREYKAELRSKGEKLNYEELSSTRSTNLNFSTGALTNAVARLRFGAFSPGMLELRKFVGPGRARVLSMEADPNDVGLGRTNTNLTWQDLAAHMETNKGALDDLREALKEPAPDFGPRTRLFGPAPPFIAIRTAAQSLAAAAVNELHLGHRQEAFQNLEALVSLARMNREEYTLVSQMIRVAVGRLGLSATWEALHAADWTEPELQQLQQAWEAVDFRDGLERAFLGERAMGEELWIMLRKSNGPRTIRALMFLPSTGATRLRFEDVISDYVLTPAYKLTSVNDDELFHLRSMQQILEGTRLLKAHQPWREAKAGFDKTVADINRIANSPVPFRYQLSLSAIPNFLKAANTAVRAETERQLTIAAIALKRYQLRYGKPPPQLGSLIPEFVSSAPNDCMSGNAVGYRLKEDGSFVLYSVGEDGRDDGGDPNCAPGNSGFDLWESRDAVWPAPASPGSVEPEKALKQ